MAAAGSFFFTPLVLMILSQECHDEFFIKFNFLHVPCLKMALSKALGYAIILGAMFVKVPQIINLLKSRSAAGLSVLALFGETAGILFTTAYSVRSGFPFSAFGEGVFMSAQNVVIVILVFHYSGQTLYNVVFLPVFSALAYALCSEVAPMNVVTMCQQSVLGLTLVSRFLQIGTNLKNGHTGQLSFITSLMQVAGCTARIFTTIQETGDALMLQQFLLATTLNGIILAQILWYWNVPLAQKKTQ